LVVVGLTPPAPDAMVHADAKAGTGDSSTTDPRVVKLLQEVWRHSKAIGSIDADAALAAGGVPADGLGVSAGAAAEVGPDILTLLEAHRSWGRFDA
ncbi:MAG: catalase HPII, partial [Allobranchiibius sp.]